MTGRMDLFALPEALVAGGLLFFVPGFAVARAVFPERRFRGPAGLRGAFELVVLSFVLSVALTVLVGYVVLTVFPSGFSAAWSSPTIEVVLTAVTGVALAVGALEGSYRRAPSPSVPAADDGEEGAWELTQELDRLGARRRALRRAAPADASSAERTREEIDREEQAVATAREAAYDR